MHTAVDAEQAATKNVNDLRHKISNGFGKLEKIQKAYDKLLESEPPASSAKATKAFEREAERLSLLAEMVGEDIRHANELLPGAQKSLFKATQKLLDAQHAMHHAGFAAEEIEHAILQRKKLGGRGSFGPLGGGGVAGATKAGVGGKLLKGAHVLGKVMKITTIAEAGIAGAKTVNHLFHGDFDEAFDEVKSFAYDQTIGTAEAIVDLGRSAAGAISDAVCGPSEPSAATVRRQNMAKERAVCYEIGADIVGTHLSGSLQAQKSEGRSLGEMVTLSGRSWTGANQVFNRYCRPLFSTR
jgi:hypothetical protein